eukprot:TRINITY_DN8644_c0_g3_i1.p1 TRINITY_DN8644_c0_g3~~TRINITY_DN8644_c0_g3_i1.p1  ORF type:complete len:120 (-),score=7.62 TRINITY_DN8644_c0_g3_i1:3-362(-)
MMEYLKGSPAHGPHCWQDSMLPVAASVHGTLDLAENEGEIIGELEEDWVVPDPWVLDRMLPVVALNQGAHKHTSLHLGEALSKAQVLATAKRGQAIWLVERAGRVIEALGDHLVPCTLR